MGIFIKHEIPKYYWLNTYREDGACFLSEWPPVFKDTATLKNASARGNVKSRSGIITPTEIGVLDGRSGMHFKSLPISDSTASDLGRIEAH
jgi:hypothetical protein